MPLAEILACIVIGVADGDTLSARCETPAGKSNVTIRVADIDAPEKGQAWGNRSGQHLAAMCFQKAAIVYQRTHDRYGRVVARVECDGIDASAEQVRVGLAWVFDRYVVIEGFTESRKRPSRPGSDYGAMTHPSRRGAGGANGIKRAGDRSLLR